MDTVLYHKFSRLLLVAMVIGALLLLAACDASGVIAPPPTTGFAPSTVTVPTTSVEDVRQQVLLVAS